MMNNIEPRNRIRFAPDKVLMDDGLSSIVLRHVGLVYDNEAVANYVLNYFTNIGQQGVFKVTLELLGVCFRKILSFKKIPIAYTTQEMYGVGVIIEAIVDDFESLIEFEAKNVVEYEGKYEPIVVEEKYIGIDAEAINFDTPVIYDDGEKCCATVSVVVTELSEHDIYVKLMEYNEYYQDYASELDSEYLTHVVKHDIKSMFLTKKKRLYLIDLGCNLDLTFGTVNVENLQENNRDRDILITATLPKVQTRDLKISGDYSIFVSREYINIDECKVIDDTIYSGTGKDILLDTDFLISYRDDDVDSLQDKILKINLIGDKRTMIIVYDPGRVVLDPKDYINSYNLRMSYVSFELRYESDEGEYIDLNLKYMADITIENRVEILDRDKFIECVVSRPCGLNNDYFRKMYDDLAINLFNWYVLRYRWIKGNDSNMCNDNEWRILNEYGDRRKRFFNREKFVIFEGYHYDILYARKLLLLTLMLRSSKFGLSSKFLITDFFKMKVDINGQVRFITQMDNDYDQLMFNEEMFKVARSICKGNKEKKKKKNKSFFLQSVYDVADKYFNDLFLMEYISGRDLSDISSLLGVCSVCNRNVVRDICFNTMAGCCNDCHVQISWLRMD